MHCCKNPHTQIPCSLSPKRAYTSNSLTFFCLHRRVCFLQRTIDYLTRAYKENDQIYLQGEQMAARAFVAAQARANGMVDGDEYLKVRPFCLVLRSRWRCCRWREEGGAFNTSTFLLWPTSAVLSLAEATDYGLAVAIAAFMCFAQWRRG